MVTLLIGLVQTVIRLYIWALILAAVFSMLSGFGILDSRNRLVWTIGDFLYRVTEPVLRPLRQILPNLGGLDLSPLVAILLLELLQRLLDRVVLSLAIGSMQPLVL